MSARAVVELDGPPDLTRLYARAVGESVGALGRSVTVTAGDLPDVAVIAHAVRPDADRLAAYQRLVGEPVSDTLPAGFGYVLSFPLSIWLMTRADFPLPPLGMLHLANRVTQHRPVDLTEPLDLEVHAAELRSHRRGVAVDLVSRVRVHDDVVWDGVSTFLAKGARLSGVDEGVVTDPAPFAAPVPTGQWHLGADVGRRYAAVSGDRNPIHTSRVAARAFGFPRRIAHGMYTAARALADVGPSARGERFTWAVEFARPVLLPSSVAVRVARDDDGFELAAWDPRRGKPHVTGSVRPG